MSQLVSLFLLAGLEDKNVQKKTAPGVTLEPYAFH